MEILRSPADAIDDLADYRAERGWVEIPAGEGRTLLVHLVDANPRAESVVLFLQQRLGAGP